MKTTKSDQWSRADLELGARLALPVLPGLIAFALAVGAAAAAKGLSLLNSVLMNAFVFAGASQLVALEVWPERFTIGAIAGLALVVATVNARILLITAALQPTFRDLPAWQLYPLLHITTDPAWLITMRAQRESGSPVSIFLGASLVLVVVWMAASTAGYLFGALAGDPRRFRPRSCDADLFCDDAGPALARSAQGDSMDRRRSGGRRRATAVRRLVFRRRRRHRRVRDCGLHR